MNERKAGHDSKKMPSSGHLIKNAYTWFLEHGSGNKVERQLEQMFSDMHTASKGPNKDMCKGPWYEDSPGIRNHTVRKSHYDSFIYSDSGQC